MVFARGLVVARPAVVHRFADEIGTQLGRFERCGATLAVLSLAPKPEVGEDPANYGRVVDERGVLTGRVSIDFPR
jgi:hypothetical protein